MSDPLLTGRAYYRRGEALTLALGLSDIYLGIDVGGSGIKSALVDVGSGTLTTERTRVETPQPATPHACSTAIRDVLDIYDYRGPIGIGFPSVIRNGVVETANNIDPSWVGQQVVDLFAGVTGREVVVINDADAAAVAEARFGAAAGVDGLVLVITFGTGIGSGLLVDGKLVPNLELGQLEFEGHYPSERFFSAKSRKREGLEWDEWGDRANRYLLHVNEVFRPDLIVFGGGLTKHWALYSERLDSRLPVVPATMGNSAGLVGAALVASR
jgi:polyphosphate glucokinase